MLPWAARMTLQGPHSVKGWGQSKFVSSLSFREWCSSPCILFHLMSRITVRICLLKKKKNRKEWWQKCSGYFVRCTTIGLRISGRRAAQVFIDLTEEHTSLETNSSCAILKSHTASRKHSRKQWSIAWYICPANPCERSFYAPKFDDGSQEETQRQERCARGNAWDWSEIFEGSNTRTKLLFSHLPTFGVFQLHP